MAIKKPRGGGIKTQQFLQPYHAHLSARTLIFHLQIFFRHIIMLTILNCYFSLFTVRPYVFCPLRNQGGGRNQDAAIFATQSCSFMSWDHCFLFSHTHLTYMNGHKYKLLFKPSFLLIGCILIPPPLVSKQLFCTKFELFKKFSCES